MRSVGELAFRWTLVRENEKGEVGGKDSENGKFFHKIKRVPWEVAILLSENITPKLSH